MILNLIIQVKMRMVKNEEKNEGKRGRNSLRKEREMLIVTVNIVIKALVVLVVHDMLDERKRIKTVLT